MGRLSTAVRIILVFFFVAVPFVCGAEVRINEIAWMGTDASANYEWIELYNASSGSISLEGWVIESADGSPEIILSGTIGAEGYFLLERNESAVPSVTADLIYSGALSNSGEIVYLLDPSGEEIDRVNGGDGWKNIGGDNETKETAQYTSGGWITDTPTPHISNKGVDEEGVEEEDDEPVEENNSPHRDNDPKADIYASTNIATVGVPVEFIGSGDRDTETSGIGYRWNFGDGTTGNGNIISHTYFEEGTYTVTLVSKKRFDKKRDTFDIKVVSPHIIIETVKRDCLRLTNGGNHSVDMTRWTILSARQEYFVFPEESAMSADSSICISDEVLGFSLHGALFLKDMYGNIISSYPRVEEKKEKVYIPQGSVKGVQNNNDSDKDPVIENTQKKESNVVVDKGGSRMWIWIMSLVLVILLAAGMVFISPHKESFEEDGEIEILE